MKCNKCSTALKNTESKCSNCGAVEFVASSKSPTLDEIRELLARAKTALPPYTVILHAKTGAKYQVGDPVFNTATQEVDIEYTSTADNSITFTRPFREFTEKVTIEVQRFTW